MKPADVAHWNEFWTEPDLGPQWKHYAACELVEDEPILDVGSGSGLLLELLQKKGLRALTGCDIATTSAKVLRSKGLSALLCDAERPLPFVARSYKTAALVDVLEHSFYPAKILAEAARVAEKVVVVVPNFNSMVARLQVALGRVPENNTPRKQHVYWFNYETFVKLVTSVGLEVEAERFHTFKYGDRLLSAPFRLLGRAHPPLFSLAFAARLRARS